LVYWKNDPNITAIKVTPSTVFTGIKSNSLVSLFKKVVGELTGNEPDLMDQGELKV
jgi:hypothetical protein